MVLSQSTFIGITIDKKNDYPIENCTILLKKDSTVIAVQYTDSSGIFRFKNLAQGNYFIQVFRVGYFDTLLSVSIPFTSDFKIPLSSKNESLQDIIIKSEAPFFERKGDRFSLNIGDNKFYRGINVWDLLKITPLVLVTEPGGIGISGTTGAQVYINDRKLQLNGEALVNYLKSISSSDVLRIEIITIPSSKYEAEGGGGIINIVLKQSKQEGLKGGLSLSFNQASYNSQSISSNINYRKNKLNFYSYLNSSRENFLFNGINDLVFFNNLTPHYSDNNTFKRRIQNKLNLSSNSGIEIVLSKKETINLLVDFSRSSLTRYNTTNTKFIDLTIDNTDSLYKTYSTNIEKTNFFNSSLLYEILKDSSGTKLTVSADILSYNEVRNSNQNTFLSDQSGNLIERRDFFLSNLPQKISNKALSIDYTRYFNKGISMNAGFKFTDSKTDNNVVFKITNNNQLITDTSRSNYFKYSEQINALYVNLSEQLNKKFDFQAGLRLENTKTTGNSLTYNQFNRKTYYNLFHTFFLNYIPNRIHQFSFAVTSRINRPSFWDINPFRYYISNNIFVTGNPYLLPSKLFKQEISYTFKGKLIVQLTHSLTKDAFTSINYFQGQEEFQKKSNYGKRESSGINLVYSQHILKPWFLRTNCSLFFLKYNGIFDARLTTQHTSQASIALLNGFTISEKKKLYLTSTLVNNFSHYSANTKVDNQVRADIYFTKISKNERSTISLSISDIFRSSEDKYLTIQLPNSFEEQYYYDSRNFSVKYSYSFGKKTIPDKKERSSGNQEEKNRVK